MTISSALAKALPAAESARTWRPALGHTYQLPPSQTNKNTTKRPGSKEDTPMPDILPSSATAGKQASSSTSAAPKDDEISLERRAEEAFMIHMRYGGEYIDENPITGRPGEFHLSSTGRKPVPPPQLGQQAGIGTMNGPSALSKGFGDDKKDGTGKSGDKGPKSAGVPKPKRRKSKAGNSAVSTPANA